MIKRLICGLLLLCLTAGANDFYARYTFTDFGANPQTTRRLQITGLWTVTEAGTNIVTSDRRSFTNDSSGSQLVYFGNAGGYRVEFFGPFATTVFTNVFGSEVTGTVNAKDYISASVAVNGVTTAYSQTNSDRRFHNVSGDTSTNAEFRGTLKIPIGPMVLGYVWTLTNITTGAGEWQAASGGGGGTSAALTNNETRPVTMNGGLTVNGSVESPDGVALNVKAHSENVIQHWRNSDNTSVANMSFDGYLNVLGGFQGNGAGLTGVPVPGLSQVLSSFDGAGDNNIHNVTDIYAYAYYGHEEAGVDSVIDFGAFDDGDPGTGQFYGMSANFSGASRLYFYSADQARGYFDSSGVLTLNQPPVFSGSGITGTIPDGSIASTIARDSEVTAAISAAISDTTFGAGWNGDTTTAPSKNAVYDAMVTYLPLIGGTMTGEIVSTLGTITTDISTLDATATWNNSGVTFCGVRLNYITTAQAADSMGFDVQFDGSSSFNVRENLVVVRKNTTSTGAGLFAVVSSAQDPTSTGLFRVQDNGVITASGGLVDLGSNHDMTLNYNTAGFAVVKSTGLFGFSSGASAITAPDLGLSRSASGTLAVGNGTQGNSSGTVVATVYQIGSAQALSFSGGDLRLGNSATWTAFHLGLDSATTPTLTRIYGPDSTGSNNDGVNRQTDAPNGTGTGGSGSHEFRTAPAAASSSTANTMETRMTIKSDGSVNIQKTVMFDQSTEPTPGANQAGIYAADVGGTAELFTVDEAGNETQQTAHPLDMPPAFFVVTNWVNVFPKVSKSKQYYAGTIEWVNDSLMAVVKQMEIRGTFASLPAELRNQIADGLHVVETFKEYKARTGTVLTQRDWATDQAKKQSEYDQKRANLLAEYQKPIFEVVTEELPGLPGEERTTRTFTNLVSIVNTNIQVPPEKTIAKQAPAWLTEMTARNDSKGKQSLK